MVLKTGFTTLLGSQEQSNEPAEPPVLISVRRRNNSRDSTGGSTGFSEENNEILLRERRSALVREYHDLSDPALQRLLSVCSPLVDMDVDIERKYVELDIWRVFEANKVGTWSKCVLFVSILNPSILFHEENQGL